jgi:hypothetical protein
VPGVGRKRICIAAVCSRWDHVLRFLSSIAVGTGAFCQMVRAAMLLGATLSILKFLPEMVVFGVSARYSLQN